MKPIIYFLAVLSVITACSTSTHAQWKQTNGPLGGSVECFATTESYVFAGVWAGGVYRSAANAAVWTPMNTGLTNLYVLSLAVSGNTIIAGTDGGGVFLSTDNGSSWHSANIGLTNLSIRSLTISGTTLMAGTSNNGVFLSVNNGASWIPTTTKFGAGSVWVYGLLAQGNATFACGSFGLFRSTDGGGTWTALKKGLPARMGYSALAATGTTVFTATSDSGVYRSTDNGETWLPSNNGIKWDGLTVNALLTVGGALFAGTDKGIYRSANGGDTWEATTTEVGQSRILSLACSSTILYAGTSQSGPIVSDMTGSRWRLSATGMNNSFVSALASTGASLIAASYPGVSISTDNGMSWVQYGIEANAIPVKSLAVVGKTIIIGGYGAISRSTDNGRTWSAAAVPSMEHFEVISIVSTSSALFAANRGSYVLRSLDDGMTWKDLGAGLANRYVYALTVLGQEIYAGTNNGIFKSVNNGDSWAAVNNSPFGTEEITALASTDSVVLAAAGPLGIFRSTDHGVSWKTVNTGLDYCYITKFAIAGKHLIAGGPQGVYASDDGGITWKAVYEGLTPPDIISLMVSGPNLFAGTRFGGLWRRPLSEIVSGTADVSSHIEQNFPNPFNGSTTINYTLPNAGHVSLQVFDILGREVATIASGELPAGMYSRQWNASGYPSGVYFYRLHTDSYTETKRLILLK